MMTPTSPTASPVPPVLALTGVGKSFPGVRALDDVSLDVRAGEIHGLVGENGAGKSTLIKIIGGYHQPDEGEIAIGGERTRLHNTEAALAAGISIVHQDFTDCPKLSVAENVYIGRDLARNRFGLFDRRALNAGAAAIFDRLGFPIDVSATLHQLLPMQRKMTEIARALAANARVLILDEPTAALEQRDVEHLFQVLKQLRTEGMGVLYVSHRLQEIFELCDRVTVLRDGRRTDCVGRENLSVDGLIAMMVGRSLTNLFPKTDAVIGEPLLVLDRVTRHGLFDDISLVVRSGEVIGLAGLIGSGRSELADALFGLRPIDSGTVTLGGHQLRLHNPRDAIDAGLCYVPQNRKENAIVAGMSVSANITLPKLFDLAAALGVIRDGREAPLVRSAIEQFGVKCASPRQPIGRLSGGNQQKVVLARWLLMNPKILIVDEPTQGVDVGAKAEIHRIIGEMVSRGLGVILISSELPELLAVSDRIVVFHEGSITGEIDREYASEEAVMRLASGYKEAAL